MVLTCWQQKPLFINTKIADAVTFLKNKGYNLVLATSPVFPEIAIHERMTWNDVFPKIFLIFPLLKILLLLNQIPDTIKS
jgi:hypothetical protein